MKRLLIVLFGVLVFQGSVWALTSADDLCQQDGDNGKATVLSPADTQELDKNSPLLLQWQDKAQWLQSKVTIKLHSRTGKKEQVVKTWPSQTNTGSALIARKDLRKVKINRNASKQDIRYFFRLTNHRKTERFIESGCFTFTKNLKRQRSRQNLKEEVAALESSLTLALATIEGLTDRLQALEGGDGTTGGGDGGGDTATAQMEAIASDLQTVANAAAFNRDAINGLIARLEASDTAEALEGGDGRIGGGDNSGDETIATSSGTRTSGPPVPDGACVPGTLEWNPTCDPLYTYEMFLEREVYEAAVCSWDRSDCADGTQCLLSGRRSIAGVACSLVDGVDSDPSNMASEYDNCGPWTFSAAGWVGHCVSDDALSAAIAEAARGQIIFPRYECSQRDIRRSGCDPGMVCVRSRQADAIQRAIEGPTCEPGPVTFLSPAVAGDEWTNSVAGADRFNACWDDDFNSGAGGWVVGDIATVNGYCGEYDCPADGPNTTLYESSGAYRTERARSFCTSRAMDGLGGARRAWDGESWDRASCDCPEEIEAITRGRISGDCAEGAVGINC